MAIGRNTVATAILIAAAPVRSEPLDEVVTGPQLICFKYSTFSLAEGESITDFSGSMEGMQVTVSSSKGDFTIGESEIFAEPKKKGQRVFSNGKMSIYRIPGPRSGYAIYAPTSFSDGRPVLLLRLSGKKLRGGLNDKAIYSRLEVRDPAGLPCAHAFTYSWDFLITQ
jgi:hypothetical protein